MNIIFNWSKKWFISRYDIYADSKPVGNLIPKTFSNSAIGQIHNLDIHFETRGLFNQKTEIIDLRTNLPLGEITYNTWKTKAVITLSNEVLEWKSLNWLNSKWGITKGDENLVSSWNRMLSGEVISYSDNPLYGLIGLFISEYFNRLSVAIFVVIFIIIIAGN